MSQITLNEINVFCPKYFDVPKKVGSTKIGLQEFWGPKLLGWLIEPFSSHRSKNTVPPKSFLKYIMVIENICQLLRGSNPISTNQYHIKPDRLRIKDAELSTGEIIIFPNNASKQKNWHKAFEILIPNLFRDTLYKKSSKSSLAGECNTPNERDTGVKIEVRNGAP